MLIAVDQETAIYFIRREDVRDGHTRPDRFRNASLGHHDLLAAIQVRGGDEERDAGLGKGRVVETRTQPLVDESVVDQPEGFIEFEQTRYGKLQDRLRVSFFRQFTRPHAQCGFGRLLNRPTQRNQGRIACDRCPINELFSNANLRWFTHNTLKPLINRNQAGIPKFHVKNGVKPLNCCISYSSLI